ncbi:MAG TPA: AAA-like domain-containing protein, partial [Verrucomicrobiae bacterium]|nr:AAA-like domain-containing protein [Verrucomicrobiae bacterium]
YDGLLTQMGRQLRLEDALDTFWLATERLGPCQRFVASIRDVVLAQKTQALVIFVDEIDTVRSLPFSTDEFFAAIRECYNRRGQDPAFVRVTFCLLGVATPSDLIRDTRTTPFNIGRRIELHDFTEDESAPLAQGLQHALSREPRDGLESRTGAAPSGIREAKRLLNRVLYWTGGHPYLTQRLCRVVADAPGVKAASDVDRIGKDLFFTHRAKERDDNLLFVRERLLRSEADLTTLLELYSKVRRGQPVDDEETSRPGSILRLSGIVKSVQGRLKPRNRIYSRVFDRRWVEAQMPDAEARRQRAAFYRGVIRTSAFAAVVVTALAIAVLIAARQASNARRALARAYYSQAQAGRASGMAGQRYQSLDALRQALASHTSRADLRDEAIACLALIDLAEETNAVPSLPRTNAIDVILNPSIAAMALPDGGITVRRWPGDTQMAELPGFGCPVRFLRFGLGTNLLAASYVGDNSNRFVLWDWPQGRILFEAPPSESVEPEAIDFTADRRRLAVGSTNGSIRIYTLPGGELMQELQSRLDSGEPRPIRTVRFNPSGDWLAVSSPDDHYVELWSYTPSNRLARLFHSDAVLDLSWHPRGHTLATACGDARVYLWSTNDLENPKRYANAPKLSGHEGPVTTVAFNHRGTLLASLGGDETLRLWVPATGREVTRSLSGSTFNRLCFSADDSHLLGLGDPAGVARVWKVLGQELTILRLQAGSGDEVRTLDFSPDHRWLLAATGRQITLWQAASGLELGAIPMANSRSAWFTGDSGHILASSDSGLFRWSVAESPGPPGTPAHIRAGAVERLFAKERLEALGMMSLTSNRIKAAVTRQDAVILLPTDPPPPETSGALQHYHLGAYYPHLALHPQGNWLAAHLGVSNVLYLWNLAEFRDDDTPAWIPGSKYFAFSPDGHWLATCSQGSYQCYRVGDWAKPAFTIPRRFASEQHAPVAFAQDGRMLAVASSRYSIQLYRLPSSNSRQPELTATLESPDHLPLEVLAFSSDGRQLAAATDRHLVELWNLTLLRQGLDALNLPSRWPDQQGANFD